MVQAPVWLPARSTQRNSRMSYPPPPGPDQNNPYGQQPGYQQPGGYPPQPGYPQQGGYAHSGYVQNAYASWGSRVVARIIDGLIIGLVPVILMIASGGSGGLYFLGVLLLLGGSIFLAHQVGTTGQTPGRKAVNIQVIKESTGQPIGFGLAIGRWLLDIVNGLPCYLGYLWPLWDAKKQTFSDKIVGSVVVKKN